MSHELLNLLWSRMMVGDCRTETECLRPAWDTCRARELWRMSSHPSGLRLSAKSQMCPGKRSFKLAKEPLSFLGVGAGSALGSQSGATPRPGSVCATAQGVGTEGHWGDSGSSCPAACFTVANPKYLCSAKQRVRRTCPESWASGLRAPTCRSGYSLGPPLVLWCGGGGGRVPPLLSRSRFCAGRVPCITCGAAGAPRCLPQAGRRRWGNAHLGLRDARCRCGFHLEAFPLVIDFINFFF